MIRKASSYRYQNLQNNNKSLKMNNISFIIKNLQKMNISQSIKIS